MGEIGRRASTRCGSKDKFSRSRVGVLSIASVYVYEDFR